MSEPTTSVPDAGHGPGALAHPRYASDDVPQPGTFPPDAGRPDTSTAGTSAAGTGTAAWRRRITAEVWIVLGLSLGQAGVYAVVRLIDRYTREEALARQVAVLNPARSDRVWLDLVYQILAIGFALVPVALALYLLAEPGRRAARRIGLDSSQPGRDLAVGVALAGVIGIPGLGLYVLARTLGLSASVNPAGLGDHWWTVSILILAAAQNALLEEVVAVAYLTERLRELRWGVPAILAASALLRGSYHLYQGPGMAVGNVVMGLLFTGYYLRRRRVMPLVVAHTTLDVVAFVGYALLPGSVLEFLHIT